MSLLRSDKTCPLFITLNDIFKMLASLDNCVKCMYIYGRVYGIARTKADGH